MVGKGSGPRQHAGRDSPQKGSSGGQPTVIVGCPVWQTQARSISASVSAVEDSTTLSLGKQFLDYNSVVQRRLFSDLKVLGEELERQLLLRALAAVLENLGQFSAPTEQLSTV